VKVWAAWFPSKGAVRRCTQGSIGNAREAGLKCSGSFVKPA
jgi:hypothetical protein